MRIWLTNTSILLSFLQYANVFEMLVQITAKKIPPVLGPPESWPGMLALGVVETIIYSLG